MELLLVITIRLAEEALRLLWRLRLEENVKTGL